MADIQPATVSGNGTYATPSGYTPTVAGTYQWVANYSGDANNTRSPTRAWGANRSWLAPPSHADDDAGPDGRARQWRSAYRYGDPVGRLCSDGHDHVYPLRPQRHDSGGHAIGFGQQQQNLFLARRVPPQAAGTYYWMASYSGDANNAFVSATEGNEPETVDPAVTLTTTPGGDDRPGQRQ